MNSEMMEAIDMIVEESDNAFEAMIAVLMYYLVHIMFRMVEVVVEFGADTQEPNQES